MKDVSAALRKAYLIKLAGLQINTTPVPGYDTFAATEAPKYYYLIGDCTQQNESPKCRFTYRASINVDIVTKFIANQQGGSLIGEQIADIVLGLICPLATAGYLNLMPDFNIISTSLEMKKPLALDTGTVKEYRQILTFSHLIEQLT